MEATTWPKNESLEETVNQANEYELFQLIRVLQHYSSSKETISLSLVPSTSLAHPVKDIIKAELDTQADINKVTITTAAMALLGSGGSLPDHLNEMILSQYSDKDIVAYDFISLFNDKILKLLYQIWSSSKFYIAYEHSSKQALKNSLLGIIHGLIGQESPALPHHQHATDLSLYFSGLLAMKVRPQCGLAKILSYYFSVPVSILPYQGKWVNLPSSERTILGKHGNGQHQQLGLNAIAGGNIYHVNNHIKITIGPISYPELLNNLPNSQRLKDLEAIARYYLGHEISFSIQVKVFVQQIPNLQLGLQTKHALGWNSWLNKPCSSKQVSTVLYSTKTIGQLL